PSAAAAGAPPVDLDSLRQRCLGNRALAAKSVQKFEGSFARDLDDLGGYVRGKSAGAVAATVHKIKGTAANVLADAVRRLAAELEDLARADHLSQAEQLL